MRGTLFFVHGTGVREKGWAVLWQRVKDYSDIHNIKGVKFVGCDWGPKLGVPAGLISDTLPPEVITRDVAGAISVTEEETDAAVWALLLDDPLFELRLAGGSAPIAPSSEGGFAVGIKLPEQSVVEALKGLADQASTVALAGTGLVPEEISIAARSVADSPELLAAARTAGKANDPDLVLALARAVVARVLSSHRLDEPGSAPAVLLDGSLRDRLVEQIVQTLAPETRALVRWIKDKVSAFAIRKATRMVVDRRQGLMDASTPALGDVLYYQRRGAEISAHIAQSLAGLERPVVAVGHSLGGIMLVDILSRQGAPPVDLLVTAGSQSPMLYAIDALESLRPGQKKPTPFTPWLNFYNRQDFLSFCASRIFTGVSGIEDVEVAPGVPFPESHSAYWSHGPVYDRIRERWPQI